MLVTFHSKAWSGVTMFGDIAVTLLKMAGHSGTVPGALLAADIPAALARLEHELAGAAPQAENTQIVPPVAADAEPAPLVGLGLRAYPLIQLLAAAARQDADVLWEAGQPAV